MKSAEAPLPISAFKEAGTLRSGNFEIDAGTDSSRARFNEAGALSSGKCKYFFPLEHAHSASMRPEH